MKNLVINRCEVCPYLKIWADMPFGSRYFACTFDAADPRKVEDMSVIPDWCPLEEAKSE